MCYCEADKQVSYGCDKLVRIYNSLFECVMFSRHINPQHACLSVSLSVSLSVYMSVCQSVSLSICLSVCLSVSLSVSQSVCQSVCRSQW